MAALPYRLGYLQTLPQSSGEISWAETRGAVEMVRILLRGRAEGAVHVQNSGNAQEIWSVT